MAAELLTQLQDQLNSISVLFVDYVGTLQRDAPPVSVGGEAVTTSSSLKVEQVSFVCNPGAYLVAIAMLDVVPCLQSQASDCIVLVGNF